jgi:hypothetical protein
MPSHILAHVMSHIHPYSERARLQLISKKLAAVVNSTASWPDICSVEIKCKCESSKGLSCIVNGGHAAGQREVISCGMEPTV